MLELIIALIIMQLNTTAGGVITLMMRAPPEMVSAREAVVVTLATAQILEKHMLLSLTITAIALAQ